MTEAETAVREALAKMTPGTLIAAGWGDGSTQMGMTNIFNEDAEVLLAECIPEHDAAGIVALRNHTPALLAELDAARAEVARLQSAIDRQAAAGVIVAEGMISHARAALEASHDPR